MCSSGLNNKFIFFFFKYNRKNKTLMYLIINVIEQFDLNVTSRNNAERDEIYLFDEQTSGS